MAANQSGHTAGVNILGIERQLFVKVDAKLDNTPLTIYAGRSHRQACDLSNRSFE